MSEIGITFACAGAQLMGVMSLPRPHSDVGVLIVVGGPQYRVGSHRQFVALARALAASGYASLRFDYRGMGDSEGEPRGFEAVSDDIEAAIDAFIGQAEGVRRIVLWGLCDAAAAALLYVDERRDRRVCGVVLANPWVRSDAGLARANVKHYYGRRLRDRAFWRKLLAGGVSLAAWGELRRNLRLSRQAGSADDAPSFRERMARGWRAFGGVILLVSSGNDQTAREFDEYTRAAPQWREAMGRKPHERVDLEGADHTFSSADHVRRVNEATIAWLDRVTRGTAPC